MSDAGAKGGERIGEAIGRLVRREDLDRETMAAAMGEILGGEAAEAQIAAFAIALRMKGETATEIAAAAEVMRARSSSIRTGVMGTLLDTCGTGGDGAGTFNISTCTALVVAAAGVPVAKHGNRAVSSRAGSADVLEALGLRIDR
ncbi:MAG: anthranilate phosphoribosyltransferase, partial [Myxococcales bacterium]|nr:anthranilate phosphoribosyltransferase [Myxococcales bacterium]